MPAVDSLQVCLDSLDDTTSLLSLQASLASSCFTIVARHELVTFLHQQLAEQKRVDASFSGVLSIEEGSSNLAAPKDVTTPVDVQLVLPGDAKKQRKQTKQILLDKGGCGCTWTLFLC